MTHTNAQQSCGKKKDTKNIIKYLILVRTTLDIIKATFACHVLISYNIYYIVYIIQ